MAVSQGTLNKIIGTISFVDHPELNITAAYLGEKGISGSMDGDIVTPIRTMTGIATSPEPYVLYKFSAHILKTNALGDLLKKRWELNGNIGDAVIHPDTTALSSVPVSNSSITTIDEMPFDGKDAGYMIHFTGAYAVNSFLFNQ